MKNSALLISLSLMLALFSCEKDSVLPGELSEQTIVSKNSAIESKMPILDHTSEQVDGASSTLRRTSNGITVKFRTDNLIPNNAYTVWWVIFGETPGPPIFVTHADGQVVDESGKCVFSSHLSVGDIFDAPLTSDVHVVLRTHGAAQLGMIPDQIGTIDGGCTTGFPSGPGLYPDSDEKGYCANVQVAVHEAVN